MQYAQENPVMDADRIGGSAKKIKGSGETSSARQQTAPSVVRRSGCRTWAELSSEQCEAVREWQRRHVSHDDLPDDVQGAHDIERLVRLADERIAERVRQARVVRGPGGVEDADPVSFREVRGDLRAETAIRQTNVEHREFGIVMLGKVDRLGDGASDATNVEAGAHEHFLERIADQEIVFRQ